MTKAGRKRHRERIEQRQAEIQRKARHRKLRTYAITLLVVAVLAASFVVAALADRS